MPKPWNKINISKKLLENLYENHGLSIAQIASKLGYSTAPIHRLLREHKIKIDTDRYRYRIGILLTIR